jgi:hypothetical protein
MVGNRSGPLGEEEGEPEIDILAVIERETGAPKDGVISTIVQYLVLLPKMILFFDK